MFNKVRKTAVFIPGGFFQDLFEFGVHFYSTGVVLILETIKDRKYWMSRQSRNLVGLYFLEGYYSNIVIEAYLKLIKNASPAEDIESYAKALRKKE